jgi:S1-C subfamily serine protease
MRVTSRKGAIATVACLALASSLLIVVPIYSDLRSTPSLYDVYRRLTFEDPADIFEKAAPSVVFIDTFGKMRTSFFSDVTQEVPLGQGSGFVWNEEGYIVTNYHVVQTASTANVTISYPNEPDISDTDGEGVDDMDFGTVTYTRKQFIARLVGVDPDKDVAVLKVDATDLTPLAIGTLKGHRIGEPSYAIGNPFGLDHSMTSGIISGLAREIRSPNDRPIQNVIQTDADINPGNSGGPLLDGYGKIIGMNTAGLSPSGGSTGVGFAVPIDDLKTSVEALIKDGKIVRAAIGISTLDPMRAARLGITKGVLVLDVMEDAPAFLSGLSGTSINGFGQIVRLGDIIVKLDDIDIISDRELYLALKEHKPGDLVKVTVEREVGTVRGGNVNVKTVEITVRLTSSSSGVETGK